MTKPVPSFEKNLHERFSHTYATLAALKNNRNSYISSQQVYAIYDQFLKDVHELSIVRKDEELKGMTLAVPNAVDSLIDDLWQLLSLLFMTCGLTKFAPATYLLLLTVYKLLSHLRECQVYSPDDLAPISSRLREIESIIDQLGAAEDDSPSGGLNHKREETLLLRNKLAKCQQAYKALEETLHAMPPDLEATYNELVHIRKALLTYLTRDNRTLIRDKIAHVATCLKLVKTRRDPQGKFPSDGPEEQVGAAQRVLDGLLDDCDNLLYDLNIQEDNDISSRFENVSLEDDGALQLLSSLKLLYSDLLGIKHTLENLLVTRRWTMRETDLYTYQKRLKAIDEQRRVLLHDGDSRDGQNAKRVKKAQLLVLYLLRRNYGLIYKLLESSEPVSESLQPIHNQLSTVRRCLLEIKRVDGLNNLRELFPFQFKLASLDNLRHDGKFIVNNQVPEGQGTLNALLAECFDIVYELKIELEEKEEEDEEEDRLCRQMPGDITDEEDKGSDDEVELKRNRYVGFNEADYDVGSESDFLSVSDSEFESNDYY